MGPVSTHLADQARSIFDQLGYTVSGDGSQFRAERGWKVVYVTATDDPDSAPATGDFHCFVTDREHAGSLRRRLSRSDPECEWAVISVGDGEDYEVVRAPPGPSGAAV